MSPFLADVPFFNVLQHFSQKTLKTIQKSSFSSQNTSLFLVWISTPIFDGKMTILGSHFGTLDPPGTPFFGQNGVPRFEFLQFFSKVRSVVPLWAPKVTPRVAQGPPKAAPRSLFGHFWTTLGHFLVDFDHFRAPFRSLLLAFGDVLRVSLISVDFYAFPAKFLTFPLKFLTFSSWKVWNILAVWIRTSKIFCRKF